MRIYKSLAIVMVLILAGYFVVSRPVETVLPGDIKYVHIAGENIKVDLAITREEQAKGLSGREGLGENEGMLFVFDTPDEHPFWMQGMKFPIDIIWINERSKVVYLKKDASPESYPKETFGPPSGVKAKYVLEVVSGFSDKNNLQIGDTVEFIATSE